MARRSAVNTNPQTIASLSNAGYTFGGGCSPCHRNVEADMDVLIARFGPDALVREVSQRIVCAQCRGRVEVQVMMKGWSTQVYRTDPGAVREE